MPRIHVVPPLPPSRLNEELTLHARVTILSLCVFLSLVASCTHPSSPPASRVDTTSHAVVWRTDTIGYGSSCIKDVSIVDDNNIWAVGIIYLKDSAGNVDPNMYNALKWDGTRWIPLRLSYSYQGRDYVIQMSAVFAFADNDVWFSVGGPSHWDGQTLSVIYPAGDNPGAVTKFWGTSSADLYTVSDLGMLTHYDGNSFSAIGTGVRSRFSDIYGSGQEVYIASYYYDNQINPSGIFKKDGSGFRFLFPDSSDNSVFQNLRDAFGVWVSSQGDLWATGEAYLFTPLKSRAPVSGISPYGWLLCIRGLSNSDVWTGGVGGTVLHFNGHTWRDYTELRSISPWVEYHCVAVKGKLVVFGGLTIDPFHAIVTLGRRAN